MVANLIHTKVICKCNDMILIGSDVMNLSIFSMNLC